MPPPASLGLLGPLLWDSYFGEGWVDSNFLFDNDNSQAFVATNAVDNSIAIAFRGSSEPIDFVQNAWHGLITGFSPEYDDFLHLTESLDKYISSNHITKVLVTGHSLGGVMAELFMSRHPYSTETEFAGITFGSPGDSILTRVDDPRLINFGHSEDPVFNAAQDWVMGNNDVAIDLTYVNGFSPSAWGLLGLGIFAGFTGDTSEHDIKVVYPETVEAIAESDSSLFSAFISNPYSYHVVIGAASDSGTASDSDTLRGTPDASDFILGRSGIDVLYGYSGNDLLDGGLNVDFLFSDDGTDYLAGGNGNDILDGGDGSDTAYFSGNRTNYNIGFNGSTTTVTDLVGTDGTDTLTTIEFLHFKDQTVPNVPPPSGPKPGLNVVDAPSTYEGAAGTQQVKFAVTLTEASSVPVTVNYSTSDGSATAGTDFVAKNGTLTFNPGDLTKYVLVDVKGDTTPEPNETFTLNLSNVSTGATISDGSGLATILNDDSAAPPPAALPTVSIADAQVVEGNSGTTFMALSVTLSAVPTSNITVYWSTSNGTATTADGDYGTADGTLTFLPGQTWPLVALVPVPGDTRVENDETFTVSLDSPSGATLSRVTASGTILNDDLPTVVLPIVSIADAAPVIEGDISNIFDFSVSLSTVATSPITVNWFTSDGTAVYAGLNGDYEAHSDLLRFETGEQFKHIRIQIDNDRLAEASEALNVSLTGANGANIGRTTATGTIIDDDAATITITDASVLEGNAGTTDAEFFVTLSNPSQSPVTVQYATVGDSATANQDFWSGGGTLTFNPGETRKALTIAIHGDATVESTETFKLNLSNAIGASISDGTGIGTIITDDAAALWNFVTTQRIAPTSNPLDSPLAYSSEASVSLDGRYVAYEGYLPIAGNNRINISVYDKQTGVSTPITTGWDGHSQSPSISADGRYVAYQSNDPTFIAGDTNGKYDIFVTDRLLGITERISLSGSGAQGDGDSSAPSISADGRLVAFVSTASNLALGDTNGIADIFVYDRANRTVDRVNVAADGTQANAESMVPVISPDGTVVAFNSLANNLIPQDHNVRWDTYAYDRVAQTLQVITVDSNGNGGFGNYGLNFRPALSGDGRLVVFNTDWGLAPADNNGRWDTYVFDRALNTFMQVSVGSNGQQGNADTEGYVQISPDGSRVTFFDFSSNLFSDHVQNSADVVVAVREVAPTANVSDVAIMEGQTGTKTAQFTISLSGATVQPITVNYLTEDGTASAGADYTTVNGSLSFAPGELTKTVNVPITSDLTFENNEILALRVSSAVNAVAGKAGIGTILNDDPGPSTVSLSGATVSEGNGGTTTASFGIALSGSWTSPVTVTYSTADGSASAGSDYQGVTDGTVTFAPGETQKTVGVTVVGDAVNEGNENFVFRVTAATNAAIGTATATGTILNDDSAGGLVFLTTERVDVGSDGHQAVNASPYDPSISGDGRFVAFRAGDSGLVTGDSNFADDVFVYDRLSHTIERDSRGLSGAQPNGISAFTSISADGRYVAFSSLASNLVPGDDQGHWDVFVFDRQTGNTERVSTASNGSPGDGDSMDTAISADGRFVAFWSLAGNLVAGDANGRADIFVHDRQAGTTEVVSASSNGVFGNANAYSPTISGDGRYVAFSSGASNLVNGDTNGTFDVFLYDRSTHQLKEITAGSDGDSGWSSISADGQYLTFSSTASNLVNGDSNSVEDVFVYDVLNSSIERVSVASDGTQGNRNSMQPTISADGRYVAYRSGADNLVSGDTNAVQDLFVFDRQTHTVQRLSIAADGSQANDSIYQSTNLDISADGAIVTYVSDASNLVPNDTNGAADLFVAVRDVGNKVSVADVGLDEGNSGTHDAVFTVSLSKPAANAITLTWSTADGSAFAGSDYAAGSGTVTFNPGEFSRTIHVPIIGDTVLEQNETFSVAINSATGAMIERGAATGTITNDDAGSPEATIFALAGLTLGESLTDATLIGTANAVLIGNSVPNALVGNSGSNLLVGSGGDDLLEGGAGNDLLDAGDGNDTVDGGEGDDALIGGAGDDTIDAGVGDDTINAGTGNDILEGGARFDKAIYTGNFADYTISYATSTGRLTIADHDGARDGTDVLHGIETLQFVDQTKSASDYITSKTADVSVYSWRAHTLLDGVAIGAGSAGQETDGTGGTIFIGVAGTSLPLTAARAIPSGEAALTDQAVNLQDAIAILKMIVGLEVNGAGKPLSPYQAYAADFDGNGTVGLTDAIGVLKHLVGLPSPDPQWLFFNEADTSVQARANLNPGAAPTAMTADLSEATAQVHVGLVGVMRGDVDGSYAGVAGAQDLDVTQSGYFQNLAAIHSLNLSQFGVYGA